MSMKCEKCNYRSYQDDKFCPKDGTELVEQEDNPLVCGHVWVKYDSQKVLMCRLPEGHDGGCKGAQIGEDGRRWSREDWPDEVRSGRVK